MLDWQTIFFLYFEPCLYESDIADFGVTVHFRHVPKQSAYARHSPPENIQSGGVQGGECLS